MFNSEKERRKQEYDDGFADGAEDVDPTNESAEYIDGYLDGRNGVYLPPKL